MKTKLTPKLAYIIGLWHTKRTKQGIGMTGNDRLLAVFSQEVISANLTTSDKLLTDKNSVYFYHSAYRILFQNVIKERTERFKYKNPYSGNYFAGLFDASGGYSPNNKTVYIVNADKKDEIIILRLGFRANLIKDRVVIERDKFMNFINRYRKILIPGEEDR